jgi:radical SAM superfamily enzyme YgiQ (UPF0313 family)
MKILITHGYFLEEDQAEKKIMKPYPPLGILYISAFLSKHGIINSVFDSTFSSKEKLKAHIVDTKPDMVAFYVNLMTKLNVLELIRFIKANKDLAEIKIILGGPEVRYNAENLLNNGADYIIVGEGEEAFFELINCLKNNSISILNDISGIAYLNGDEKTTFTSAGQLLKDIDSLPFPNRDAIDIKKYQEAWKNRHGFDAISVSTMRGCPYTCKWCSRAVYGLSYRRRSPKLVVDEMEMIKLKYNPDTLWFVDDVFTISHKWFGEFNSELKKRNIKINYECITRADRMNEEIVSLLKESGCYRVWIGAESGSQKIIDAMDRRVKVEQVREMIKLSKRHGIESGTFIMLGYPGETKEDIEETIKHLNESNPDHFTITLAYPIKGTEFFQEVEDIQTGNYDWENQNERERDFNRTYSRRYYDFAVRHVVNEVNYHKNVLDGKQFNLQNLNYKVRSLAAKSGMALFRKI